MTHLPKINWEQIDSDKAVAEGWDIFSAHGSTHGSPQIQRVDRPDGGGVVLFEDDSVAWKHVRDNAMLGERLHKKALAILATENPHELSRVIRGKR